MRSVVVLVVANILAALLVGCDSEPEASSPTIAATVVSMTPEVTSSATPPGAPGPGTFETLLGWVSQDLLADPGWDTVASVSMGDIEAWREASGNPAPGTLEGEVDDLEAWAASEPGHATAWNTTGFARWFLGVPDRGFPMEGMGLSERTTDALGFGRRDIDAFAVQFGWHLGVQEPYGVMTGDFDPDGINSAIEACSECEPVTIEEVAGTRVYIWGDDEPNPALADALPIFMDDGRGGALAVFEDRVVRTMDLDAMRSALEGPTLAELDGWPPAARVLDEADALYAQFIAPSDVCCGIPSLMGPKWLEEGELPLLDPWLVLASGGRNDEDGPVTLFVLSYPDEGVAGANVDRMEERLAAVPDDHFVGLGTEPRWGDIVTSTDVASQGAMLVVTVRGIALAGFGPGDFRSLFWADWP